MATKQPINRADIRFSRFRLEHEDLSSGGSGCVVYHIPSKQSGMSEVKQPYALNKKAALSELAQKLGIPEPVDEAILFHCKECGQELVPSFPDWQRTQLYTREYGAITITVFFLTGEEDPEMTGWTWGLDGYSGDYEANLYETPEGAIRAAEHWATEAAVGEEDSSSDDKEGEREASESPK